VRCQGWATPVSCRQIKKGKLKRRGRLGSTGNPKEKKRTDLEDAGHEGDCSARCNGPKTGLKKKNYRGEHSAGQLMQPDEAARDRGSTHRRIFIRGGDGKGKSTGTKQRGPP